MTAGAGAPLHEKVLSASSADETTHTGIFVAPYSMVGLLIVTSAGVSAGNVTMEMAATPDFAGTWLAFGTPAAVAAATTVYRVQGVNTQALYVRARIDTAIVGGTIDVWIVAN